MTDNGQALDMAKKESHWGTIGLSEQEIGALASQASLPFENHPRFRGVTVRRIDPELLPHGIYELIDSLGGELTEFMAVKTSEPIPDHAHLSDGEIYLCGQGGIRILLRDGSGESLGLIALDDDSFTVTMPGERHGVQISPRTMSLFYAAKFVLKK